MGTNTITGAANASLEEQLRVALKAQADAEARNTALEEAAKQDISVRLGKKGTLCVYGCGGRYPVTLYSKGWKAFLADDVITRIRVGLKVANDMGVMSEKGVQQFDRTEAESAEVNAEFAVKLSEAMAKQA